MHSVLLIDDELLARALVKEFLSDFPEFKVIGECNDGFEGFKAIHTLKPDLIFLDIQMPKLNGFEMLEIVEHPTNVIFTTAFDEFAVKAFEAHAVDYLLKPFSKERFKKALEKYVTQKENQKKSTDALLEKITGKEDETKRIVVKSGNSLKILATEEVEHIEAYDDYVKIFTLDGNLYVKKKTMSFYEKTLPQKNFIRAHRSYILQVQQIVRLEPYEKDGYLAILKSNKKIPVSKTGYSKLKELLNW
ncbi:MAG: response regulator [Bacteroidetes bacterium]|nr:response regulator [Bacteroidota bacterium]